MKGPREMRFLSSILRLAALSPMLCLGIIPATGQANAPAATAAHIERIQNGVQLAVAGETVRVQFYAEGTVRIEKWPTGGKSEKVSLSVVQKELPTLDVRVEETPTQVTLNSGAVKLLVSRADGSIQFLDNAGQIGR